MHGPPPDRGGQTGEVAACEDGQPVVEAADGAPPPPGEVAHRLGDHVLLGDGVFEYLVGDGGGPPRQRDEARVHPARRHLEDADPAPLQLLPEAVRECFDVGLGRGVDVQLRQRKVCGCGAHLDNRRPFGHAGDAHACDLGQGGDVEADHRPGLLRGDLPRASEPPRSRTVHQDADVGRLVGQRRTQRLQAVGRGEVEGHDTGRRAQGGGDLLESRGATGHHPYLIEAQAVRRPAELGADPGGRARDQCDPHLR